MSDNNRSSEAAIALWREHGGILRTGEALALGVHPRTVYALRDAGVLEKLGRGLYRLADLPPLSNPDLVTVARMVPRGVICLVSALAYHELTTQIPRLVDLALERGGKRPQIGYPPLRVFWFSGPAWREGIETPTIDDTPVRVYSAAKSIADAFKFRQQVGLDVAIEALRTYRQSADFDAAELTRQARNCRVERVMRPYIEALL